jgi:multidrug efflux pump subunit AcrA (membrane-fusion protein)
MGYRIGLAQFLLLLAPGLAAAQTAETMPMEQVKDCICQQQQLEAASARVSAASGAYSQRQQELQTLEQQLADLRRTATPGDEQAVVQSQALIDRRNLLRSQLRDEYGPYQSMARDYNERAERYNATCTTLPMLSFDVVAAKENLSCPAQ